MSTKFTTKNLKNLLTNPSAFGKCGKGKVVRINLTQAYMKIKYNISVTKLEYVKESNHYSYMHRLINIQSVSKQL